MLRRRNADAGTDRNRHGYSSAHGNRNRYGRAHSNRNRYGRTDSNRNSYGGADSNGNSDCNPNSHGDRYRDSDGHCNRDCNSDGYADINSEPDPNGNSGSRSGLFPLNCSVVRDRVSQWRQRHLHRDDHAHRRFHVAAHDVDNGSARRSDVEFLAESRDWFIDDFDGDRRAISSEGNVSVYRLRKWRQSGNHPHCERDAGIQIAALLNR